MLKTISVLTIAGLLFYFPPAQAQEDKNDSLPSIPKDSTPGSPNDLVKVDQAPGKKPEKRVLVNPMELIMEREKRKKESNQKNFWVNKELLNKENDKDKTKEGTPQKTKQEIVDEVQATQSQNEEELTEETVTLDQKVSESTKTKDKDAEETVTSKSDEEAEEKTQPVENDRMASESNTNKPDKEKQEAKQLQQYKSAIQSIPKVKKPARVWSVD